MIHKAFENVLLRALVLNNLKIIVLTNQNVYLPDEIASLNDQAWLYKDLAYVSCEKCGYKNTPYAQNARTKLHNK